MNVSNLIGSDDELLGDEDVDDDYDPKNLVDCINRNNPNPKLQCPKHSNKTASRGRNLCAPCYQRRKRKISSKAITTEIKTLRKEREDIFLEPIIDGWRRDNATMKKISEKHKGDVDFFQRRPKKSFPDPSQANSASTDDHKAQSSEPMDENIQELIRKCEEQQKQLKILENDCDRMRAEEERRCKEFENFQHDFERIRKENEDYLNERIDCLRKRNEANIMFQTYEKRMKELEEEGVNEFISQMRKQEENDEEESDKEDGEEKHAREVKQAKENAQKEKENAQKEKENAQKVKQKKANIHKKWKQKLAGSKYANSKVIHC